MPLGDFAGGFASAYSQSSSQTQEKRRLADVLQLQREQFDYSKKQDDRQYEQEERKFDFTQEQEASMEKHRDFADQIAKRGMEIQQREADLKITESFLQLTDPTIPKIARQFIAKQMAQSLGIDPKSEQFKDMQNLVTGLEPDALTTISEALIAAIPGMELGQATAMGKAVLSGQVPFTDLLGHFKAGATQLKEIADPSSTTGRRLVTEEDAIGAEAPAPAPAVSIESKVETAEQKGLGEADIEEIKAIGAKARSGSNILPYIRTFRAASESGQFTTGSGAGIMKSLSGWAEYLGMDAEAMGLGGKAIADVMETSGNQIVVGMAEQLGRSTNLSIDILRQAGPGLFKTPEGNKLAMDLLETVAQRDIAIDRMRKRDYSSRVGLYPEGKRSFFEARDAMIADYAEEDKALEARMRKAIDKGSGIDWSKVPGVFQDARNAAEDALTVPSAENDWEGETVTDDDGNVITWDGDQWLNADGTPYGSDEQ